MSELTDVFLRLAAFRNANGRLVAGVAQAIAALATEPDLDRILEVFRQPQAQASALRTLYDALSALPWFMVDMAVSRLEQGGSGDALRRLISCCGDNPVERLNRLSVLIAARLQVGPIGRQALFLADQIEAKDAAALTPESIHLLIALNTPKAEGLLGRWLEEAVVADRETPTSHVFSRLLEERLRDETRRLERELAQARHEGTALAARVEATERAVAQAEAVIRELQAVAAASESTRSESLRLQFLGAIASLAANLEEATSDERRLSQMRAILAQFGIRRAGEKGATTAARSDLFDFIGNYVPEGSPALILRPAWYWRTQEGTEQALIRGVLKEP